MGKKVLRIFSGLFAVIVLSSAVVPASAADELGGGSYGGGAGRSDFFTWADGFGGGSFGGGAGRDDSKAAYDAYVSELPGFKITSDGAFYMMASHLFTEIEVRYSSSSSPVYHCGHGGTTNTFSDPYYSMVENEDLSVVCSLINSERHVPVTVWEAFSFQVPIAGYYQRIASPSFSVSWVPFSTSLPLPSASSAQGTWAADNSATYREKGSSISTNSESGTSKYTGSTQIQWLSYSCAPPVYKVIPYTPIDISSGDTYNINTRPTSITGGNYGIVGDNGQIVKVEDNSTIVNETNNTYYNPATGTTSPIIDWSYNYSDRSYTVTTETGDTVTITYGDENITIKEGDTIYNVYYLAGGSGSETPPEACTHEWTETSRTEPACTRPGSVVSTCSKCSQTKTEAAPALGHDWQVKQTVTTEYDDTGQLVQEGYTIFECSRCHEQYKSADGTIPPGGSSTDPGEDKETLWDKLGKLLGTAVKGILDLLGSAVDVVLGGLIDLVTNLFESLKQLVDLFGSVGEAFGVLWTWLPPEIMAILVAGVSIFVFVALLKLFMK